MQPLLLAKASGQSALYQGARRPRKDLSHLKGKHFPYRDRSRRKGCFLCPKTRNVDNKRKDTKVRVYCTKCNEFLCMDACFEHYHTHVNFKH